MKSFDPEKDKRWKTPRNSGVIWSLISMLVLIVLLFVLKEFPGNEPSPDDLVVYCAAGIRLPVEEAAAAFEEEFGVSITLDYDSSGALEGKLQLDRESNKSRADLYIPADVSFAERAKGKGLTLESIPIASFRLVLASSPKEGLSFSTLDEFLALEVPFSICNVAAGVGKKTKGSLEKLGKWEAFESAKKTTSPRVTDAAAAIATSDAVQAGFVWDTTARQFGLKIHELPELAKAQSGISVNVTSATTKPAQALLFARYLAAPGKGQNHFDKHHFSWVRGDAWEKNPELTVYCGGVNRDAVYQTLRDFEKREGCRILEFFNGCGSLVANIKTVGQNKSSTTIPDAFLTCDASYMTKVEELFGEARNVSGTDVVMLVRKGNPKGLKTLGDLGKKGVSLGTTDPKASTLGDLSWQLLEKTGVASKIKDNDSWEVTTPSAHELIMQMEAHPKLDVTLVYLANCQNLTKGKFETVAIADPLAKATQNIAVSKNSNFPQLTARLIKAITSTTSRERFLNAGFYWKVPGS
jgi:ABC-type molybdate transport system substrate-binding protein